MTNGSRFRLLGPAMTMTAGIMGAGSTTSLLLGGAYFGYDLLWATLIILPIVVVCQDTASRIGSAAGGRGMMRIIAEELHPAVMWLMLVPMILATIGGNAAQFGVMHDTVRTFLDAVGGISAAEPTGDGMKALIYGLLAAVTLAIFLAGGYKTVNNLMSVIVVVIILSFLIVAVEAFFRLSEIEGMLAGLAGGVPGDLTAVVGGKPMTRSGMEYLAAIVGGAIAPTAFLSYAYFTSEGGYTARDNRSATWRAFWTFGVMFGLYSVIVLVAGAYRLHPLPHALQIQNSAQAGVVLTNILGPFGTAAFAVGLFSCAFSTLVVVAQLIGYFLLDALKRDWKFSVRNRPFMAIFTAMILLPALLSLSWQYPDLLKIVLTMTTAVLLNPFAVFLLLYLSNKTVLVGEHRSGRIRNILLVLSILFSVWIMWLTGAKVVRQLAEKGLGL